MRLSQKDAKYYANVKGTMGISGGKALEKKGTGWVKLEFFIVFQIDLTGSGFVDLRVKWDVGYGLSLFGPWVFVFLFGLWA